MRFAVAPEHELFAASVRGVLAGWEPTREPVFGEWWDERDDTLADRLAGVGWEGLGDDPDLLGAAVAGAIELGRAVAPVCLVDEATLGAPLAVGSRVRHGEGATRAARIRPDGVQELLLGERTREPTLDGCGTVLAELTAAPEAHEGAGVRAWSAATLGYLAGLAAGSLEAAVGYASSREQFGAPLGALPAVQARLADARLAADGVELLAWQASAAAQDETVPAGALLWASGAVRDLSASMHQVYGGVGFALESGVHRAYRRAKSLQLWTTAVARESSARS